MPWYFHEELIGYIEMAQDVRHILKKVSDGHAVNLLAVVRKEYLEQKQWEIAQKIRPFKKFGWDLLQRGVVASTTLNQLSVNIKSLINQHQSEENRDERHAELSIEYQEGELHTLLNVIPISDFVQRQVGDLIVVQDVSKQHISFERTLITVSFISAFSGLLIFFLFFKILGRVQQETVQYGEKMFEAMESAEAANLAKDEFLASMSHELRPPLTSIIGCSELLLGRDFIAEEREELVHSIQMAGRSQLALVNDILDMSKMQSGQFSIDESPYNLSSLTHQMEHFFLIRARDAHIEYRVTQEFDAEYQLIGDQQRIGQILINLIGNAFKFTSPYGCIIVTIFQDQEQLCFEVKDSGIGMRPDVLNKIFQRFEQAEQSTFSEFGGSGLGLYISNNLTEMMRGSIRVESVEGEGSTFTLRIPYRESEYSAYPARDKTEHTAVDGYSVSYQGRVLVAEDVPALQLLAEKILESMGAEVVVANNGQEAVSMAVDSDFDLILMDMQMPVMDGLEATQRLREGGKQTPIVALTANVMQKHRESFKLVGCDGFLNKPIERQELEHILRQYLKPDSGCLSRVVDRRKRERRAVDRRTADRRELTSPVEEPVPQVAVSTVLDGLDATVAERLMAEFYQTMAQLNKEVRGGLSDENWKQLHEAAHVVKGSGAAFGYPALTASAEKVCDAIDQKLFEMVPSYTEALLQGMGEVVE